MRASTMGRYATSIPVYAVKTEKFRKENFKHTATATTASRLRLRPIGSLIFLSLAKFGEADLQTPAQKTWG